MIDAGGGGGGGEEAGGGFMWLASGSCQPVSEVSSSIWSHYHVKGRGRCLESGGGGAEYHLHTTSLIY